MSILDTISMYLYIGIYRYLYISIFIYRYEGRLVEYRPADEEGWWRYSCLHARLHARLHAYLTRTRRTGPVDAFKQGCVLMADMGTAHIAMVRECRQAWPCA